MIKRILPATLALVALTLSGCADLGNDGSSPSDTSSLGSTEVVQKLDALYKKAVDNGENLVVTYGPAEESYSAAYEKFTARYPKIKVENEYIFGAELAARLDQEFASGKHVGSIQNGGPALTSLTYTADRCAAYEPFGITKDEIGADQVSPDNKYRALSLFPFGIAYNKDQVKAEDAPASFGDLTDSKWSGKLLVTDPHRVNGFTNSLAAMLATGAFDTSWPQGIAANNPLTVSTSALAAQSVARGERAVDVMGQYNQYLDLIKDGLPIGFVFPTKDATRVEYHYSCLLKDGPAPAATELLYNWLYTAEGQNALASGGVYGVRPGSTPPGDLPPLSDFKSQMLGNVPVKDAAKAAEKAIADNKNIFK